MGFACKQVVESSESVVMGENPRFEFIVDNIEVNSASLRVIH